MVRKGIFKDLGINTDDFINAKCDKMYLSSKFLIILI